MKQIKKVPFRLKERGHYTLALALATFMMATLTACSGSDAATEDLTTISTAAVEETVGHTEEVQNTEPEVLAEAEPTEEVVEETIPEEPQVEMVDFETWAKQEDHDEVCLVVWNEEQGVQEIMPTLDESGKDYEVQSGDRFAIPNRINISYISVNGDTSYKFGDSAYLEISLNEGEISYINLDYYDEAGEIVTLVYTFK